MQYQRHEVKDYTECHVAWVFPSDSNGNIFSLFEGKRGGGGFSLMRVRERGREMHYRSNRGMPVVDRKGDK